MSPAVSRLLDPLRFRPLLWMAFSALAGVALGGNWASDVGIETRGDARWNWLVLPGLTALFWAWQNISHGFKRRIFLALALFFGFAAGAARRVVPPDGDISLSTRLLEAPEGPIPPVFATLRGTVADYPKVGDFSIQFPLQCEAPRAGRVWVSAPYGTPLQVGDRIQVDLELRSLPRPTNPGERASFWRYIVQNCWCLGVKPGDFRRLGVDDSFLLARRIGTLRVALLDHYERAFRGAGDQKTLQLRPFPAASAQLMTAMVFGEGGLSRPLPQQVRDDFRAAGLSHVLVASGTQVAFLTVILLWFLGQAGVKHSKILLLAIPVLIFYALLAGGATSIYRATLSGFLLIYALLLGRDVDGLSLWGGAILALLIIDPLTAWSLSFQLTFAATWGLLTLAPPLSRLFARRFGGGKALELAAFSLGAQAATIPISLFHFGTFSASGLGANFVAVPVAGLMVGTGLLGLIFPPINPLNYFLTRGIASGAHGFALLPGAQLKGSPLGLPYLMACYALFLLALTPFAPDFAALREGLKTRSAALWRASKRVRPAGIGAACLLLGSWLFWLLRAPGPATLRVTMFDVGQGECMLIRTPAGHNILIDGGSLDAPARSDIGAQIIVPALQNLGVSRLDLMVLTHADADHCNGLLSVARELPIGAFVDGPAALGRLPDPAQTDYFALRRFLDARSTPIITPRAGQSWQLGAASLKILAPTSPLIGNPNDDGLVCRMSLGKTSMLFTADIEAAAETRLLSRHLDLSCTVLKVGHHGSKTSTTPAFLRAANPLVALISCGRRNSFGHPALQTLRALKSAHVAALRTDLDGTLQVECGLDSCFTASRKPSLFSPS